MGYTHFYNFKPKIGSLCEALAHPPQSDSLLAKASADVAKMSKILSKEGVLIKGGDGTGKPIFTSTEINFNGDASEDLDHENFFFDLKEESSFCKTARTARKPYDKLVCCALLSLKAYLGDSFSFSSDGDENDEEWKDGYEFWAKHSNNPCISWEDLKTLIG